MEATRYSYKDVVKSLLEMKANPNITEKVGLSVLLLATCFTDIVWITSFSIYFIVPGREDTGNNIIPYAAENY
jgi:hypothetical protein